MKKAKRSFTFRARAAKALKSQARIIVIAIAAGLIAGALDGLSSAQAARLQGPQLSYVISASAALVAMLALVVGVLEWLVLAFCNTFYPRRLARVVRRARAWIRLAGSRAPTLGRNLVVSVHATLVAWVLALAAGFAVLWVVTRLALGLQVKSVSQLIIVTVGAALLIGTALLAQGLAIPLRAFFRVIDRRVRLPLPPWRRLRAFLYLLPVIAVFVVLFTQTQQWLGVYKWPALLLGFALLQAAVAVPLSALWRLRRRKLFGRGASVLVVGSAIGLLVWTALTMLEGRMTTAAISDTTAASTGLTIARVLTDRDRDGYSALFAGGDCAPANPEISPGAREIQADGIDQDCNGRDQTKGAILAAPVLERFSDAVPAERVRKYNIIWIIIDAVRADDTSLFGYQTDTTPYLRLLANESLTFEKAYSQSSSTLFSLPSQFTGSLPTNLKWAFGTEAKGAWKEGDLLQLSDEHETVAEMFGRAGYGTAINMTTYMLNSFKGMQQGYEKRLDLWIDKRNDWGSRSAPIATMQAIDLVTEFRQSKKPFFLTMYYEDPHGPYNNHPEGFPNTGKGDRAFYQREIAFADRYIGFLYEYLNHKPEIWKDTIFIVTSDHGEEFKEHGHTWHGTTCHVEQTHVPLLIRIPGIKPARIKQPVALIDILPTLVELTGVKPQNPQQLDGQSLLAHALSPQKVPRERPIFCAISSIRPRQIPFFRSSVRYKDYALFYEARDRYKLFFTPKDPGERDNVYREMNGDTLIQSMQGWLRSPPRGNLESVVGF